jgi:hypothetical protein
MRLTHWVRALRILWHVWSGVLLHLHSTSRLLAGMSLLRRCFAQAIPPKRTSRCVQLRKLG